MDITAIIIAAGIPSAMVAFCFNRLQKKIDKKEKHREEIEHNRRQNELLIIKGLSAAIALSEATAVAVQKIPDAHCNGDMHDALKYARKVKHEHKDFMYEAAVDNLVE